jgi:hypothetical protein
MTTDERLDRLTADVKTLAEAAAAHDPILKSHDCQISALIELTKQGEERGGERS